MSGVVSQSNAGSPEIPYTPSLERPMAWLRGRLTPHVLKEIAEADCGSYDKSLAKVLRDSVEIGRPTITTDSVDLEGLALCSNHWYKRVNVMITSGALLVAFYGELDPDKYFGMVLGHAGRIARVSTAVLELDAVERFAYAELLAWATTKKPYIDDDETPLSMLWYSHLCVLATLVGDTSERDRSMAGAPWLTREFVEGHAAQVDQLIDHEMSGLAEDPDGLEGPTQLRRLVSLEDIYGDETEWWGLTNETLEKVRDTLPVTREVLLKVQADRPV